MRQYILLISVFLSVNVFGQNLTKKELNYIPKNFNESLIQLDKLFPDSTKSEIKLMTENDFLANTHLSTGMFIRNEWLYNRSLLGLRVTDSDLRKELLSKGLFTNDDMSSVILRSFYRQLNNQEILFDQQVKDIRQWHINMNNPDKRKASQTTK